MIQFFGKKNSDMAAYLPRLSYRAIPINDEQLRYITAYIRGIGQLDLDETNVTGEGLAALAKLEYVHELRLKNNVQIDDHALGHIINIKSLRLLHLHGTSVTLKSAALELKQLSSLGTLFLSAKADDVTQDVVNDLKLALPGVELVVNHVAL